MKRFRFCLAFLPALIMACASAPPPEDIPVMEEVYEDAPAAENEGVSQELYDATLAEVRQFIDSLNSMIRSKNYAAWKGTLSDALFARISSPAFLASTSESAALRTRKIVLKSPEDYFEHVVVPSRSNSRVDEIEFTASDDVKVFFLERSRNSATGETETRRLRLYELFKDGDTWKIID